MPGIGKPMGRIPIILADVTQTSIHKDKELLMNYDTSDIYLFKDGQYINITGRIKDQIQEIQDGSMVIHICTEQTLPAIKDRRPNHWYYIILKSEYVGSDEIVNTTTYVYYGVIDANFFNSTDNYILVAQNTISNTGDVVRITAPTGYKACFYVPTVYRPKFFKMPGNTAMTFNVVNRLYILDTSTNDIIPVDVYVSEEDGFGDLDIKVDYSTPTQYMIEVLCNEDSIKDKITPGETTIYIPITIPPKTLQEYIKGIRPVCLNPRWVFQGWSSSKTSFQKIDPTTYAPHQNMKIYMYFKYVSPSGLSAGYTVGSVSSSGVGGP